MVKRINEKSHLKHSDVYEDYDEYVYLTKYLYLNREEFCCNEIYEVLLGEDDGNCELSFGYDPVLREYFIDVKPEYGGACQPIKYCPWCGKKFPKELLNDFLKTLSKELNIREEDIDISELKEKTDIPEEFKTDEWWKKRGLK